MLCMLPWAVIALVKQLIQSPKVALQPPQTQTDTMTLCTWTHTEVTVKEIDEVQNSRRQN